MKSDEQIAMELQGKEFQEIEIPQSYSDQPEIVYEAVYPPLPHEGFQPCDRNMQPAAVISKLEVDSKFARIVRYARIVLWSGIIDLFLMFLFLAGRLWYGFFLIIFPLFGTVGVFC